MTDLTDLIERLRFQSRYTKGLVTVTMFEAANELERLQALASERAKQGEPVAVGRIETDGTYTVLAAPPADDEAVKLLREAKDYLDRWEARPSLQLAIDAYLAKVKT